MNNEPFNSTPTGELLSFSRLGGLIFGGYSVANLVIIFLLLAHVVRSPLDVLFGLSFFGPPGLVLVLLTLWCDTARPGRSKTILALLLAGAVVVAVLNLLCLNAAVASV